MQMAHRICAAAAAVLATCTAVQAQQRKIGQGRVTYRINPSNSSVEQID